MGVFRKWWVFSQIIPFLKGFSIRNSIHFGGKIPLFLETPKYIGKLGKTRHPRCAFWPNIFVFNSCLDFWVSIHQLVLVLKTIDFFAWSFFGKFV